MKHSIQIMGARAIAVLLCAGVLLTLAGCGGKDGHSSASASAPAPSTSTPAQSSTGQPAQTLTLYYGDQNAEYLLSKTVDVPEITPAAILSALQDAGVVDKAVTIEKSQLDGDAISVDCSAAFQTQLQQQGTAGERILVGSVVNTFLTAYGAKELTLSAGGKALEGHMDYSEPLTFFEAAPETTITAPLTIEGEQTDLELTKILSQLGCAIGYDPSQFTYDPASSIAPVTFLPKDSSDTVTRFTIRTSQASVKDETARLTKEETATLKDQDDKATVGADALPATRLTFQEERDKDVGGLRVAQYYLPGGQQQNLDCPASDLCRGPGDPAAPDGGHAGHLPAGPLSAFLPYRPSAFAEGRSFFRKLPRKGMISPPSVKPKARCFILWNLFGLNLFPCRPARHWTTIWKPTWPSSARGWPGYSPPGFSSSGASGWWCWRPTGWAAARPRTQPPKSPSSTA